MICYSTYQKERNKVQSRNLALPTNPPLKSGKKHKDIMANCLFQSRSLHTHTCCGISIEISELRCRTKIETKQSGSFNISIQELKDFPTNLLMKIMKKNEEKK